MESVDIIKLMKAEQEQKEKDRTNTKEEHYLKTIYAYYDKFVKPKIDMLILKDKLVKDDDSTYSFIIYILKLFANIGTYGLVYDKEQEDFYIHPFLYNYYHKLGSDNLPLLETKDKDFKNEVASKICEIVLIRKRTKQVSHFFIKYIEPLLEELNKQNKIVYDMTSSDTLVLKTSQKVKGIISNVLGTITGNLIMYNEEGIPKEDTLYIAFMTNENVELKKEIAKDLCDGLLAFYKDNDFSKLSYEELLNNLFENGIPQVYGNDFIVCLSQLERLETTVNTFTNMFIVPILIKLGSDNVITFDMLSTNEEVIQVNKNTIAFMKKFITQMFMYYVNSVLNKKDMRVSFIKDLFNESIEQKRILANRLCNSLLFYYESIDFLNIDIDNFNFNFYSSKLADFN